MPCRSGHPALWYSQASRVESLTASGTAILWWAIGYWTMKPARSLGGGLRHTGPQLGTSFSLRQRIASWPERTAVIGAVRPSGGPAGPTRLVEGMVASG